MKERLFIRNIGTLAGITSPDTCCKYGDEMSEVTCLHQAWLIAEDGVIKEYGTAEKAPQSSDKVIDVLVGTTKYGVLAEGASTDLKFSVLPLKLSSS